MPFPWKPSLGLPRSPTLPYTRDVTFPGSVWLSVDVELVALSVDGSAKRRVASSATAVILVRLTQQLYRLKRNWADCY